MIREEKSKCTLDPNKANHFILPNTHQYVWHNCKKMNSVLCSTKGRLLLSNCYSG